MAPNGYMPRFTNKKPSDKNKDLIEMFFRWCKKSALFQYFNNWLV